MRLEDPLRIAIIGAGASGTLLTVQLCRIQPSRPIRIYLIENKERAGKGLAYSTSEPLHLLNVPAAAISALPDEPDHFVSWLADQNLPFAAPDFVPRYLYGQYLTELLQTSIELNPAAIQVEKVSVEALSLNRDQSKARIKLSDGDELVADKVVLALGNFPPGSPCAALSSLPPTTLYAPDPWAAGVLENLAPTDPVLLVGTGLTMVDVLMSLYARNHRGRIIAVSTHGLLPNVHMQIKPYKGIPEEAAELKTVQEWLPFIRRHIQFAVEQGLCWRSVIDAFRPYSQAFWLNLSVDEKIRFLRHMRHLWAIARHRMPPITAEIVQQLIHTGQLKIWNGRIINAQISGETIKATVRARKGKELEFESKKIINCTGPESDYRKVKSDLIKNLLEQEFISLDPLFLGLAASPAGQLLDSEQQPSDLLFSLGPPLKGILWESTAIAEIRAQAKNLAALLVR